MLVRCHAEVKRPTTGTQETTNEFYFLFSAVDQNSQPITVPTVKPRSYAEYMLYLDGRRRVNRLQNVIKTDTDSVSKL